MVLTSILASSRESSALNFAENILREKTWWWFFALQQLILTARLFLVRIFLIGRFNQPLFLLAAKLCEGRDQALSGFNSKDLHSCRPPPHPADSPLFAAEHLNPPRFDTAAQPELRL